MDNVWRYCIDPRRVYTVNAPSIGNNEGRNTPVVLIRDPGNPTQAVVLRPTTNAEFFNHVSQVVPLSFAPQPFAPQSYVPQTFVPQSFVPQSYVPQSYVPQSYVPQSYVPQSHVPQSFAPLPQTQNIPNYVNPSFVGTPAGYRNIDNTQPVSNAGPHFNSYVNMTNYNVNINMRGPNDVPRRREAMSMPQGQIFEMLPENRAAPQSSSSTIAYRPPENLDIVRRREASPLPQSQIFEIPPVDHFVEQGRPEFHGAVISPQPSPPPIAYRSSAHSQRNFSDVPGRREITPLPQSRIFEIPPIDHFVEQGEQENRAAPQPTSPTIAHRSPTRPPGNLAIAGRKEAMPLPQSQVFELPPIDHFVEQGGPSEHHGAVISRQPSSPSVGYRSPTRSASPGSSIYYCGDSDTCESPGSGLGPVSPLTISDPEFQPPPTLPSSPIVRPVNKEPMQPAPFISLDNAVHLTPESFSPYGDLLVPDPDLLRVNSRKRARPQSFKGREKAPPLPPDENSKIVRVTDRGVVRSRAILAKYIPRLGGLCSLCPNSSTKRKRFGPRTSGARLLEHLVNQHFVSPVKNMYKYNPEKLAEYATQIRGHLIETKEQFDYTRKYVDAVKCGLCAWDVCFSFRETATIEHLWKSHWKLDETVRQEEKKRLDDLVPHRDDFYSLQDKFLYNFPFTDKEEVDNVQESLAGGDGVSGPSKREGEPENIRENDPDRSSDSKSRESTAEWFSEGEPDNIGKSVEWSSDSSSADDENGSQPEITGEKPVDYILNMRLNEFFDRQIL